MSDDEDGAREDIALADGAALDPLPEGLAAV
jgi:hypothetical protein